MADNTSSGVKPDEKRDLVEVAVGERRSLHHDGQVYGPGRTVKIDKADVAELTRLGYLVDPNAKPPEPQTGPRIGLVATERR